MNPLVEAALAENFEVEIAAFIGMAVVVLVDNPFLDYCSTLDCLGTGHKLFDYDWNSLSYHLLLHILLLTIEGMCQVDARFECILR